MMFHHSRWRSPLLALTCALMFALGCLALATIAAQAHHDPSHDQPPGLEDSDGDGVKDVQDTCPLEPGPASNDGCPASSPDSDGDGVGDSVGQLPERLQQPAGGLRSGRLWRCL